MKICHAHNLNDNLDESKPFGLTVSLPPGDTFQSLLGNNWERTHWFATETERDLALEEMASEHLYSRRGDRPTLNFKRVNPLQS
jgi:hypothetical protein